MKTDPSALEVDSIHVSHLNYMQTDDVRAAYLYLVRNGQCQDGFHCYPRTLGSNKDKRLFTYDSADGRPFELIVNQEDLLFYFRKASAGYSSRSIPLLTQVFGAENVKTNPSSEITVRIATVVDASRLVELIFGSAR